MGRFGVWRSVVILVFLCGMDAGTVAARAADRPNVIVVLTDDLCHGDLSCCGGKVVRTPNIDRIFAEGITLSSFRANSSVCSPSRAALLTGRYPDCVGVPGVIRTHADDNWGALSREAVLLPALLGPNGYATALIGKWHLGLSTPNIPTQRGFGFFHGFLGDMMDDYETHLRHHINYMRNNLETIAPRGHATDLFTEWTVEYLGDRGRDRRPFFLLLTYNAPHAPIQPPDEWLKRVRQRAPELAEVRARRCALVEHLDAGIGRVMAALAAARLDQNTLVIFTSDNGGPLPHGAVNEPFRDGKGSMYEGGLRVPFGARWPGHIAPGSSSHLAVVLMDLFPTVLEATGGKAAKGIDGVSFLPTLLGNPQTLDRPLFFMRREGGRAFVGHSIDAVVEGDWKLVHNSPFGPLELFNLKDDPGEARNLAKRDSKKLGELSQLLSRHTQAAGATPWQKQTE